MFQRIMSKVIAVFALASLIWAGHIAFALTGPINIVSPANDTWNNSNNGTQAFRINFIDPANNSASCALVVNGAVVKIQAVSNNTNTDLFSNTSFVQGANTWYVNCTNTTSVNSSTYSLKIDTIAPIVSGVQANTTYVKSGGSLRINVTVTDAASGVNNNSVYLKNETGYQFQMKNTSATNFEANIVVYASDGMHGYVINASDSAGTGNRDTSQYVNITVDTAAPTVSSVSILPSAAYKSDNLLCYANASDNLAGNLTVYWIWYNGSTPKFSGSTAVANNTNWPVATLAAGNLTKGDVWNCSVIAGDGLNNATVWQNATRTISDSVPTAPVPSYPASISVKVNVTTFTWSASTDPDGDAITYGLEISAAGNFSYLNQSNYTIAVPNYTSSPLKEGRYYWHAFAITSTANSTVSSNSTFIVDLTPPGISISAPSLVYLGDMIYATCTASDNFDISPSPSCGCTNPIATTPITTVTCSSTDTAGNTAQASTTVNAWSRPSGGGSGGGGNNATQPSNSASYIVGTLEPGIVRSINITASTGLTQISIEVNNTANHVELTVTKLDQKPVSVTHEISGKVYRYIEIKKENLQNEQIKNTSIKFKVEKSWLSANNADKGAIALNRFEGDKWAQLPTRALSEDNSTVYYEAQAPGFSYFAISVVTNAAPEAPSAVQPSPPQSEKQQEEQQVATPDSSAPSQAGNAPLQDASADGKSSNSKLISAIILLVILLFVFLRV